MSDSQSQSGTTSHCVPVRERITATGIVMDMEQEFIENTTRAGWLWAIIMNNKHSAVY